MLNYLSNIIYHNEQQNTTIKCQTLDTIKTLCDKALINIIYLFNCKTRENNTNNTEIGVFKTSDGKNILKDIQKLLSSNEYYEYKGLYNNKKISLAKIDENENYISYSGDMDGADRAQCYTKHFVINKKNNTIINTTIPSVSFIKVKNGYYFKSNGCDILDYPGDVYTSNGKLLGTYLGNTTDNNGNIYVGNSIYSTKKEKGILKYDINGKLLMQENSYHYIRGVIYNNQCYALGNDGKTLYLVNVSTKDKTLLTNIKNRDINDYYDNLTLKGNVITIELSNEEMQFTYDIKTKKLTNLNGKKVETFTKLEKVELTENNKTIKINNKEFKIKTVNDGLYINDKLIEDIEFNASYAIVTDKLILFTFKAQCGDMISYAINENGNVTVWNREYYHLNDIKLENNKIVATADDDCPCLDGKCNADFKVEIVYDGKDAFIEKVK